MVLGACVSYAQSGCPPKELPYFEDFEDFADNPTCVYGAQGTDHCWILWQGGPFECAFHSYLVRQTTPSTAGIMGFTCCMYLECGFFCCDYDNNGWFDSYFRFQHIAVSPPLAESPGKVTFKAGIVGSLRQNFAYVIVGYVSDTNNIKYSFHALDTIAVQRRPDTNDLTFVDSIYWNYDTLILNDTLPTPCRIAFRLDSTLQRRNHPFTDTTNWTFQPSRPIPYNIFNDDVYIDDVTFHPRTHIYYDYYDTLCQGESYSGYGFNIAPEEIAVLHQRDSLKADTTFHLRLHLFIAQPNHYEQFQTLFPGQTIYFDTAALTEAGDYTFSYTNQFGCDSTVVIHIHQDIQKDIWFPNVFTPEKETNNLFRGYFNFTPTDYQLYIYNRWGELVFSTERTDEGWDGTSNGIALPQGAYVYLYKIKDSDRRFHSAIGTVTLLR